MISSESHVAIYVDFDNVVISRASQVKETGASATVAIDVLLDFATRYGRLTISRAYADWSMKKNADYKEQLVARAVELVQLFPATKTKNGADIRLAVDAIEDKPIQKGAVAAETISRQPRRAYPLINEALHGLAAQHPDREWHALGALKSQIMRIEPAFKERDYGAASFSELLGRYGSQVEVKDNRARLR
jgi:hypothetical protein